MSWKDGYQSYKLNKTKIRISAASRNEIISDYIRIDSDALLQASAHLNLFFPGPDYPNLKEKGDLDDARARGCKGSADFNLLGSLKPSSDGEEKKKKKTEVGLDGKSVELQL